MKLSREAVMTCYGSAPFGFQDRDQSVDPFGGRKGECQEENGVDGDVHANLDTWCCNRPMIGWAWVTISRGLQGLR
jgi:hypothetical protein